MKHWLQGAGVWKRGQQLSFQLFLSMMCLSGLHRRKVLETALDFRHSLERVRPGLVFSLQFCDTASKAAVLSPVIVCSVLLVYFLSPLLKFSWAWI